MSSSVATPRRLAGMLPIPKKAPPEGSPTAVSSGRPSRSSWWRSRTRGRCPRPSGPEPPSSRPGKASSRSRPHPCQPHQKADQQAEEDGERLDHARRLGRVVLLDGLEVPELLQPEDNPPRTLLGLLLVRLDAELGDSRRLVGIRNSGERRYLPAKRLLVKTLHVPLGAHLQRRVHEDLDKVLAYGPPDLVTSLLVRRDGRDNNGHSIAGKQIGNEPDPKYVRIPVLPREPEALREIRPNDIPIKNLYGAKAIS